jgi:hypothetical protein
MRSIVDHRISPVGSRIHPALRNISHEIGDAALRLLAYVGGLTLLAMVAVATVGFVIAEQDDFAEPQAKPGWSPAGRSIPAFAVSQADFLGKTGSYEIFRHPDGGRKDILRWAAPGQRPAAELELYRPGAEFSAPESIADEIAARIGPEGAREIQAAGIIDSKFGPVRLIGFAGPGKPCLGFIKQLDAANLSVSGWSCQADNLPAQRAGIACLLSRVTLLSAGNDPRLADLFARAELKRTNCGAAPSIQGDWIASGDKPPLRGPILQN